MAQDYPHLFSPLTIGKKTFRNRIMAAPTSLTWHDFNGGLNENSVFYYEDKARGGAASVTLSETTVSRQYGGRGVGAFITRDINVGDPCVTLNKVVNAIKRHGALASIQLCHVGDVTWPHFIGGRNPIGPNSYTRKDGVTVTGMDEELMQMTVNEFALAASEAIRAGFDMIMIHGAHGWLLSQFLSGATNWRKDNYGGSLENRARFPIEVVKAMRKAVSQDILLEYRISGDEYLQGGLTKEEAAEFGSMIQDYVDIIHVSAGSYYTARQYTFPGIYQEHGINIPLAEAMKKKVGIPVATVGAHYNPEDMERILDEGKADFIAIGRAIIADPELPAKIFFGQKDDVIPCVRCTNCLGGKYNGHNNCDVNPISGEELYTLRTPPVQVRRKVLIVGGGPGGMQAAVTAAQRGHEVILVEKSDKLGGTLKITDYDPHKFDLMRFKNYLIRQLDKSAVEVRLNTEATPELLEKEQPYAVIVAAGALPIRLRIPGMDKLTNMHASETYTNLEKIGNKVVMIGGGLMGCEVAVYLAFLGKKVTVIEMLDEVAQEANIIHKASLMEQIDKLVTCKTGIKCEKIDENGIYLSDKDGNREFLEADTVVYAVGVKPNNQIVNELRACGNWKIFRPVGDCDGAGRTRGAVHGGYFAAMDII